MNNWQTEYRVKYYITFIHDDGRSEVVSDDTIIECRSPEEAEKIILEKYENSDDPLTDFPDGWFGHINSEELEIDEIEKVWEYYRSVLIRFPYGRRNQLLKTLEQITL